MNTTSRRVARAASLAADSAAAALLAGIFTVFLVQIFTRYAAKIAWIAAPAPPISNWMESVEPLGWTVNLISLLWVWLVFFGGAFVVRDRDHVTFDILYLAASPRRRRVLASVAAIGVVAGMAWALPATWDAVFANRLMDLKKIQTLRVPITGDKIAIKWVFAPVVLLMATAVLRALWRLVVILRRRPSNADGTRA